MGDFSAIKCVGKYAARLGQSLSSSVATFVTKEFEIIPDIEVCFNNVEYIFTDGIGNKYKFNSIDASPVFLLGWH